MRTVLISAALCAAFAGCASLAEHDCRSDAYLIGFRDGRMASVPQIDAYAAQCKPYGVQPDATRYMEGWQAGNRALRNA